MKQFLKVLETSPESVSFNDTIAVIDANYDFIPGAFLNGDLQNEAGQNNGSCKIFSFAKLQGLTPEQTLNCFGIYYREDVLGSPGGVDHQNIRNFMVSGWSGLAFEATTLTLKIDSAG